MPNTEHYLRLNELNKIHDNLCNTLELDEVEYETRAQVLLKLQQISAEMLELVGLGITE